MMNHIPEHHSCRGTLYGVILNDSHSVLRMGSSLSEAPYKATPQAPILYIKPANTLRETGAHIAVPNTTESLEIGASIGIVIGRDATRLDLATAQDVIAGYVLAADLSIPHSSYYRPAIREKCFDGACVLGTVKNLSATTITQLELITHVNGLEVGRRNLSDLVRNIPTLLRDVTEFMTLRCGDVLLVGVQWQAPLAAPGDHVTIDGQEMGDLHFSLTHTLPPTAKEPKTSVVSGNAPIHGRIVLNGVIHEVEPAAMVDGIPRIRLADGRTYMESEVEWLPPVAPGTIFALGLNYADHAAELAFKAPEQPLVFLKGPNSLTGHYRYSRRPADVSYMHYECELAVVIGKEARHVSRAEAYDYVAGYTVANDYAIRDYLENYYRPNLRVKNRDACTPIGPWLVAASSIGNPMQLSLQTTVNGKVTQQGNTADMVFDIPYLIEYLSAIMTLSPGDIILTGTPEGLANVVAGDTVVTEIAGIGRLVNTIVGDVDDQSREARAK